MSKIRQLSEIVSGRIAAGEVVERPASIVKELVENCVDASATSISISIDDGGVKRIRVADNGLGIEAEDMPLTVVKHATSKIFTLTDLNSIQSMGFRGEALSSISAVSMTTIKSRRQGAEAGAELFSKGGKVEYIREAGLPEGTSVTVENLFFNTPARLKFLKKTSAEAAQISDTVARLILAYPNVSIKYANNGEIVYHSPGSGSLADAVASVYGPSMTPHLLPVDFAFNGIHVTGLVGSPNLTYRSSKYSSVYVNSRYIKSPLIHNAVMRSFGERLLKGNYPFYALHLDMDVSEVDVNVHPNKLTVHFSDDGAIEYIISSAISEAIAKGSSTPALTLQEPDAPPKEERPETEEERGNGEPLPEDIGRQIDRIMAIAEKRARPAILRQESSPYSEQAPIALQTVPAPSVQNQEQAALEHILYEEKPAPEPTEEQIPLVQKAVNYKIIGSVFDVYVLMETGDALYFIDQHAAHERLIYDKLLDTENSRVISQTLLIPFDVTVSHEEKLLLDQYMDAVQSIGLVLERRQGMAYRLRAVPQILGHVEPGHLLEDVLEALANAGQVKNSQLLRERLAKGACKRAVKGGQALSKEEMERLVRMLQDSDTIPNCPHGRPIAIALTQRDVEKAFKRRV